MGAEFYRERRRQTLSSGAAAPIPEFLVTPEQPSRILKTFSFINHDRMESFQK
jgi:hypothetical protein